MLQRLWSDYGLGWSPYLLDQIGVVDRCLQLNAQQIATMPLRLRHDLGVLDKPREWVHDPDPAWFPNGIKSAIFAVVYSIYAHGEAFLWATSRYEDDGHPRTWTVLDAVSMHVEEQGGTRAYRSNGYDLDAADVLHIIRNPTGRLRGTSALSSWWASLQSLSQAEAYAADVYQSTGVNRVALRSTARRLDKEQAEAIQAQWVEAVSRRFGAPAVIPPDIEVVDSISVSPKDLLLLESRDWDTRQIAAAFGVPAILLNIAVEGALVYQNPQQLAELWFRTELAAVAERIAEALTRWLPRGRWVEFDSSRALQPPVSQRIEDAKAAVEGGFMTVDEARAWVFDWPPLAEGDQTEEVYEEDGTHGPDDGADVPPDREGVVIA